VASFLTLRLDEKIRKRIALIAHRKKISSSEVVRRAIKAWADLHEPVTSPYQAISDLIGVVRGGNRKRSAESNVFSVLRTIGEESQRNGTDSLSSRQIDRIIRSARARKKVGQKRRTKKGNF